MAKWNKYRKVLDHEHSKFWRYEVKDVEEPNLQKEVFPYDEVCRIDFDHKLVMINPADDIFITDTTFRDGQQARPPYTVEQIVDLYDDAPARRRGRDPPDGVLPLQQPGPRGREPCRAWIFRFPEVTGWIRAVKEDVHLVKEIGLKETGILTSVSDYHIFLKLERHSEQAMEMYLRRRPVHPRGGDHRPVPLRGPHPGGHLRLCAFPLPSN